MFNKFLLSLMLLLVSFNLVYTSQENPSDDKTLSPYFSVMTDEGSVDALPLLNTYANVNILGVIADVTVRQIYTNRGEKPLEAVYTFPVSTRAAVYSMTMIINDRILKAEVQTQKQARETYEKAKQEGRSASLLEQQRPNVFRMNVANIMPGDTIIVEMKYTELLVPENGVYEFVYPTVVGPRYVSKTEDSDDSIDEFFEIPYTHEGEAAFYDFDIVVKVNAGMPLSEVYSLSHKINVNYTGTGNKQALIKLKEGQNKSGNKDFVLKYSLSGDKISTGLILSKGKRENFFLLMLQPPKKVRSEEIPPREYIFVVDVSGSMNGYPLDISKKMLKELLGSLREKDLFNVLLFAGGSHFLNCRSVPATASNIKNALEIISKERGGGGTELLSALKKVYNNPKASGYSRSMVILTDGYITVEEEAFDLIANNLNKANVFAFGIGTSVNRYLIEGIARVGNGSPFFVTNPKQSDPITRKFLKYIESPVMTDIKVEFNGFNAFDVEPKSIADVFEQRPIIIYGKWSGMPQGKIRVKGRTADGTYLHVDIPVAVFAGDESNEALKYIWARKRIANLSDYINIEDDSAKIAEVTDLGLKYNLLTKFTSFVAVDYEVRNDGKEIVKVRQPLPLPEGVSEYAVGKQALMVGGTAYRSSMTGYGRGFSKSTRKYVIDGAEIEDFDGNTNNPSIQNISLTVQPVYPAEAVKNGIGGKVRVWALFKGSKDNDKAKCVYVEEIDAPNEILLDEVHNSLKNNAIYINRGNIPYFWALIEFSFDIASRKIKVKDLGKIYEVYSYPKLTVIKPGSGMKVEKGRQVKIKYSVWDCDCNLKISDKIMTFVFGDKNTIPMFALSLEGMHSGTGLNVYMPDKLLSFEESNFEGSGASRWIYIEILDVK